MNREELERVARAVCPATLFYDLCDCLGDTTDAELLALIDSCAEREMTPQPAPSTLHDLDKAEALAEQLRCDDPDWNCQAVPRGRGRGAVAVFDEEGSLVGYL